MSLQKPDLALLHLQKAITLNAGNEVSWYRLSQVQGMLGHAEEQKRLLQNFSACAVRNRASKKRVNKSCRQMKSPHSNSIGARRSRNVAPAGPGRPGLRSLWAHNACALPHGDYLVGTYIRQGLPVAARPADLDFRTLRLA